MDAICGRDHFIADVCQFSLLVDSGDSGVEIPGAFPEPDLILISTPELDVPIQLPSVESEHMTRTRVVAHHAFRAAGEMP